MRKRDGYGRCAECGLSGNDHIDSCPYRREWRPLLNGEYPPPGPTRTGLMFEQDGRMVAPVYVYAEVGRR